MLGASETGLEEQQGSEGVYGLRRALQEAVADVLLVSMCAVLR